MQALLPMLGFIVDKKYVSVYGSVYAIADISYCAAYAVGPVIAGQIVESMGFVALNLRVAILSLAYCPMLYFLKNMHDYQAYEPSDEPGVVLKDPPAKEYQTIALQETSNMTNGYQQQQAQYEETNFANFEQANFQGGAQQLPTQPASNPFKSQAPPNNPFR